MKIYCSPSFRPNTAPARRTINSSYATTNTTSSPSSFTSGSSSLNASVRSDNSRTVVVNEEKLPSPHFLRRKIQVGGKNRDVLWDLMFGDEDKTTHKNKIGSKCTYCEETIKHNGKLQNVVNHLLKCDAFFEKWLWKERTFPRVLTRTRAFEVHLK